MVLSKTQTDILQRLVSGDSVAASLLRKDVATELLDEGLLTVRTNGSRRSYAAIDAEALRMFVETNYDGLNFVGKEILTRAEMASETGNSKLVVVRSCPGFPVNSYEPIACVLNGREFVINPQEGSFVFVADWREFKIPAGVIVVGIENMENFRMIRQQRELFKQTIGSHHLLFVSRYPQSTDLRSWLQTIPNCYIHFGDFDLAGISVFLREFHAYLGERSSFFIPSGIEQRLSNGSLERYSAQYLKYKNIKTNMPYLQHLIDTINYYHRCYDQEGYINI